MEINKNGSLYEQAFITSSVKSSLPQKVNIRRRCQSECLQISRAVGKSTENGNKDIELVNDFKQKHTILFSKSESNSVRASSENNKKLSPVIEQHNRRSNGLNKNHVKENISTSPIRSTDFNLKAPEISDLRDLYLRDMEQYKEKIKNKHLSNNANNCFFDKKITNESTKEIFYSDKIIFDTNRRRVRTRSESEPNEIYNSKYTQLNKSVEVDRRDDIGQKRARDDIQAQSNGNSKNYQIIGLNIYNSSRESPTRLINHQHTAIVNNHLYKNNVKIQKNNVINNIKSKIKRPQTPSFKTKTPSGTPTHRKKSLTPPPAQSSPAISQTTTLSVEAEDSDAECSSLDDDDDFGDIGEDDLDITDDEETYRTQIIKTPSENSLVPPTTTTECVPGRYSKSAPLSPSLFPFVPPYISFASHSEKGPTMPAIIQKILKWKLTTITPIVVRKVLINSGFKLLKKTNDWMGIWGKHMKSPCFKTIRSYQKFNHIPGSFQIGRKDRVWRNLQTQMKKHGKKEFGFMPRTYIIPQDLKLLRQAWPRYSQRNVKWIIKPPAAARGTGIKVVNRWSQIPKRKPLIVQRYVDRPMLINGSKFDLRLYVLVTSINPLRIYLHTDGLARFASVKYSEKTDTLNDRYMHLTNYSINKLSSNYAKNEDANACKGHKWTVKSLWTYLSAQGVNVNRLWGALRNLVLRTVLAGEGPIYTMTKLNMNSKYNCYELFGIDVILDSELVPWLLEVNISPSLHSASPLDLHVKGPLVQALMNTALYQIPPKLTPSEQNEVLADEGLSGPLTYDKRIFTTALSKTERIKHNKFTHRSINRDDYLTAILDNLTSDDIRCLIITEDELARCAPLERIFPAPNTHKYLIFTESPRYYNRLLDAWEFKYGVKKREEGIEFLKKKCEKQIHLKVPPNNIHKEYNTSSTRETSVEQQSSCNETENEGIIKKEYKITTKSSSSSSDNIKLIKCQSEDTINDDQKQQVE